MDSNNLSAIDVHRRTGSEEFLIRGESAGFNLLSFWQWSSSDIVGNALRGVLAEYIVTTSVGDNCAVRTEWDAYDVKTSSGVCVEVKSGAYLQRWKQERLSAIQFSVRPTYGWDSESNTISDTQARQADVYVFCVLAHKDKATVNPLNLDQWEFYCIATETLNQKLGRQKTLGLNSLLRLNPVKASFVDLPDAIQSIVISCD